MNKQRYSFHWGMPLVYENKQVGRLEINITPDDQILENEQLASSYFGALSYVGLGFGLFKKEIEVSGRIHESYFRSSSLRLLPRFFFWRTAMSLKNKHELLSLLYISDEALFNYIESYGPIALRTRAFQERFYEWIKNLGVLGIKLQQVKNSLLKYAKAGDKLLDLGKPPLSLTEKVDRQTMRDIYTDIRLVLKNAKKIANSKRTAKVSEIIQKAYRDFCSDEIEQLNREEHGVEVTRKVESLKAMRVYLDKHQDPISLCLLNDRRLLRRFRSLDWYPNNFAKEIQAAMFGISISSIEKFLRPSHR